VKVTISGDNAGSLSRAENGAILVFIVRSGNFPSGEEDLRMVSDWRQKLVSKGRKSE
jgi:hypothetical protein